MLVFLDALFRGRLSLDALGFDEIILESHVVFQLAKLKQFE